MYWSNYHTHTNFCDGKANPEDYILSAIKNNVSSVGFSGHAPLPFKTEWNMRSDKVDEYVSQLYSLKEKYKNQLEIYSGFEVDYISGLNILDSIRKYSPDYFIGSVHILGFFDNNEVFEVDHNPQKFVDGLKEIYKDDIRKLVTFYYEQLMVMIETYKPDIIGHLDLIKKFNAGNRFFSEDEKWYISLVHKVIEIISNAGCIVEVNTRGYYKGYINSFYPASNILKECYNFGIPVTISSDAHLPDEMINGFDKALDAVRNAGYKSIRVLSPEGWIDKPLTV
jgi:histidinol-phosphatase (PHP family)